MIFDLSGKEKSALLGAAEIALGLMSRGLMGDGVEAPRVPRPEVDISSLLEKDPPGFTLPPRDRHENAAGKALCGACGYKAVGREWRCTVQDEPYNCPACHDSCEGFLKKPSAPRPPQPKKKGLPVPPGVTFLYFGRPELGFRERQGIVTVAWKESSPGTIVMGFSFCSPEDRWCKATGRDMAITRLSLRPLVIPFLYSPKRTVHEVARAMLSHDFGRIAAIAPGVTMFGTVPSWTRGLAERMEDRRQQSAELLQWATNIPDYPFVRGQIIQPPPEKPKPTVRQIVAQLMRDITQLENK